MNKIVKSASVATSIVIAGALITGCSATSSKESGLAPSSGANSTYQPITGWTLIPSDNQYVTNVFVRKINIDGACYLHTGSEYDYTYQFIPIDC